MAAARVDAMKDDGQTWGIGLAAAWADGHYLQINCRSDGRWEVRQNGYPSLVEGCGVGSPVTVALRLSNQVVQLLGEAEPGEWNVVAEFPRKDFPGIPSTVRVGKIGPSWNPQNHGEKGTLNPCRVEWVRLYE